MAETAVLAPMGDQLNNNVGLPSLEDTLRHLESASIEYLGGVVADELLESPAAMGDSTSETTFERLAEEGDLTTETRTATMSTSTYTMPEGSDPPAFEV